MSAYCASCGVSTSAAGSFCSACGTPLQAPPPPSAHGWQAAAAITAIVLGAAAVGVTVLAVASRRSDDHRTTQTTAVTRAAAPSVPRRSHTTSAARFTAYGGRAFTASVPTGWRTEADDADHGAYLESKWRDPAHPDTSVLIDATPGYTGTAEEGATSVRNQTERTPGYREISFGPAHTAAGRRVWRWQFELGASRRVDDFFVACGTGVAVLGSASVRRFADEQRTFDHVTSSTRAAC